MRRSDSRSGLARSNSTRSIASNAENNAARSAAAAAASALANAQRRSSIDGNAARPTTASAGLARRDSVSSLRSNTTAMSNRPGQYSAVRQTGSRRLYGTANSTTTAAPSTASARTTAPVTQTSQLRETMRSKPPQVTNTQRRQPNMSSSASIRSFQSDLERINEDYNKTYAYAGQTSASAMRAAAPASARGRRAESVASSAMSDTSEVGQDARQRRKASRVSFSDVDESEIQNRGLSPNPEKRKSSLKSSSSPAANGTPGRGIASGTTLMPPPSMHPPVLQRRGSNASIRSNTSVTLRNNTPVLAPPLQKQTQVVPTATEPEGEDGNLSTIESNSAYSDADEDFKASPALKRQGILTSSTNETPLQLTQQNLAAVDGSRDDSSPTRTPLKSALKKTPSQSGSARFSRLETDSQLDVADDESDDSFAARRRAKQIGGKRSLTTLRGTNAPQEPARRVLSTNGSVNGRDEAGSSPAALHRSTSVSSQQSRTSQGPSRMVSLRQNPPQKKRQSMSRRLSSDSTQTAPNLPRRASLQSMSSLQPPLPPKSIRRASVAGSVAESVRSDAVSQHVAVMELAQRRVQKMLHPGAAADVDGAPNVYADAPERRKSSFERKRPTTLSRQNSNGSMVERSFRTSLRPEPAQSLAEETQTHRRAASDDHVFATTMRNQRARPPPPRATSSTFLSGARETQSTPATPRKSSRRMSFGFGRKKDQEDIPPVPAMRRYSSDSEDARPSTRAAASNALSAGTLRSSAPKSSSRPAPARHSSDIIYSEKTGKPKKFQALRKLFKLKG